MSQSAAILSTPFNNELPIALEHGENIFFSNSDEDSLYNAIKLLVTDKELCKKLRKKIHKYWKCYASPIACIQRFLTQ
jgi:hypothetical protein